MFRIFYFIFILLFGTSVAYSQTPQQSDTLSSKKYDKFYRNLVANPVGFNGPGREKQDPQVTEVLIGVFGPSKGERATAGVSMFRGAQMAIEEANLHGGYRGKLFKLVFRPDDGPWGTTARQVVKLIYEDRVWAILGSVDGPNTHIAEQVITKAWVPLVTPTSTDPSLTQTNIPWIFRCMPDDEQQAIVLAEYIFHKVEYKKVAGLTVNDHYGRYGMTEFENLAKKMKSPLVVNLKYNLGDNDFSKQLSIFESSGVQAVVVWGTPKETAEFLRQMREKGMKQAVFCSSSLAVPEFLEAAGTFAEGVTVALPYNYHSSDTDTLMFGKRFRAEYGQEPDMFATYAYDGTRIIIEAIRSAGLNRARIRDAITEITDFNGTTGKIAFDKTGRNIAISIKLSIITKGRFQLL